MCTGTNPLRQLAYQAYGLALVLLAWVLVLPLSLVLDKTGFRRQGTP